MGELKPIGSEKLQGQEKIKRILELTYYQENTDNTNKAQRNHEYVCEGKNGVFSIDKEKDGFYVKKGLTEETLDYIGGMFMKNKNKFRSYGEALKRLELLRSGELNEATRYTLKQNPAPAPTPASEPAPTPAPVPENEPMPTDTGDGEEAGGDEDIDPIKKIQKTVGKLGQELRDAEQYIESEDLKSMFNSILSAVDVTLLSDEDKDEILNNFEPQEDEIGMEGDDSELDEILNGVDDAINTPLDFDDEEEEEEFNFSDYEGNEQNSEGDESFGEFEDEEGLDEEDFSDTETDTTPQEDGADDEAFEAHGTYTISNNGGYEIMISPDGDGAKVKEQDGTVSDWLEIEYIDDEDTLGSEPVIDPNGYNIPLSQVMRINRSSQNQNENSELDINELKDFINHSVKNSLSEYFK